MQVRANPGAARSAGEEYQIVTTSAALAAGRSASTALPRPAAVAAMQADPTRLAKILSRIDDGIAASERRVRLKWSRSRGALFRLVECGASQKPERTTGFPWHFTRPHRWPAADRGLLVQHGHVETVVRNLFQQVANQLAGRAA